MLGEACELASIRWRGCEPVVEKTAAALHGARALPEELLLISEAQYADRESWNAKFGRWEPLPPPRDPARPIHWVEAADLDGEPVWLPAAYCLSGFELGYHEFAIADSNGCASGPTRDWAIRAAFLELSERDAVARWWHAGESRPGLEPERLIEAGRGGELLRWIRDRPRSLEVLDLSLDGEAIAFAAVSYDEKGRDVALGFGACFQPEGGAGGRPAGTAPVRADDVGRKSVEYRARVRSIGLARSGDRPRLSLASRDRFLEDHPIEGDSTGRRAGRRPPSARDQGAPRDRLGSHST